MKESVLYVCEHHGIQHNIKADVLSNKKNHKAPYVVIGKKGAIVSGTIPDLLAMFWALGQALERKGVAADKLWAALKDITYTQIAKCLLAGLEDVEDD